jgi:hypothetical protein
MYPMKSKYRVPTMKRSNFRDVYFQLLIVFSALVRVNEELLERKVAAPV